MKAWKRLLNLCLLAFCILFFGKTDVLAATYDLPISETWTNGELTERGGVNWYRVTIPNQGTLTIQYQGLGIGYSYVYIYDEDMAECYVKSNLLGNTSTENPKTMNVEADLSAGTYMVRIHGHAGSCTGTYRLRASFESANSNEIEPNDKYETAMKLSGKKTIKGFLSVNEDYDFYRFTLPKETFTSIRYINHYNGAMPEPGVDGIIAVYDSDYRELYRERPINREFLVNEKMPAGTYYIRVSKYYGGSGKYILQFSDTHTHSWDKGKIEKEATCSKTGKKVYTCTVCEETKTKTIAKKAHTYKTSSVTKATTKKDGKKIRKCSGCGRIEKKTIPYAKSLKLSKLTYTYNGKIQKPAVTVIDANKNPISSSNYSISYSGTCKSVGAYKVTVRFKGNYTGSFSKSFKINPKAPKMKALKGTKKGFIIKWKKQSSQESSGYQIQYSLNKSFRDSKTLKVQGNKAASLEKTGLKAKKNYYVRIRSYKTVSKKTYYSSWSEPKKVVTKR
ncbi:MAG: fibronectin type III domain-containing protein [Lachnospiraceae bacterium]|nr:fibronectin type III domain-containing protein [Lachnospiraceae bacterium]